MTKNNNSGSLGLPAGRYRPVLEKPPQGTLSPKQRQQVATKPTLVIALDPNAYTILSAAASLCVYLSHTLMTSHAATIPSAPSAPTIMPRIN